ncbi:MAG: hypothetical protein NC223_03660 [Butyrivibrio sp.]|nr:hypothetical protein [Butyrivibrio sp.]
MKRILTFILICILGSVCAACSKGSSALSGKDKIMENMSNPSTENEAASETESEEPKTDAPQETAAKYELNTVEALEDDGKEMSAAEAIKSTMKGRHSALELMFADRVYTRYGDEGWQNSEDSIKDMPDTGLARINILTYNRMLDTAITPIEKADWESFVCVDLDQNGTKEVLVKGGPGGVILHYDGGEVYMSVINTRIFPSDVYENGICVQGAGSAWSLGHDRYYPAKGAMYRESLTYIEEGRADGSTDYYEIDGKEVPKEEYYSYIDGLIGGLTPLEWHEFTEENIDKYVVD